MSGLKAIHRFLVAMWDTLYAVFGDLSFIIVAIMLVGFVWMGFYGTTEDTTPRTCIEQTP